jgi:hypothetical protein
MILEELLVSIWVSGKEYGTSSFLLVPVVAKRLAHYAKWVLVPLVASEMGPKSSGIMIWSGCSYAFTSGFNFVSGQLLAARSPGASSFAC